MSKRGLGFGWLGSYEDREGGRECEIEAGFPYFENFFEGEGGFRVCVSGGFFGGKLVRGCSIF